MQLAASSICCRAAQSCGIEVVQREAQVIHFVAEDTVIISRKRHLCQPDENKSSPRVLTKLPPAEVRQVVIARYVVCNKCKSQPSVE